MIDQSHTNTFPKEDVQMSYDILPPSNARESPAKSNKGD